MTLKGYRVRFQQQSLPESQVRLARAVRLLISHAGSRISAQAEAVPPTKREVGEVRVAVEVEVPA